MVLAFHLDDLVTLRCISLQRVKLVGAFRGRPAFAPVDRGRTTAMQTSPVKARRIEGVSNPGASLDVLPVSADS